jgi:hypothetical protein
VTFGQEKVELLNVTVPATPGFEFVALVNIQVSLYEPLKTDEPVVGRMVPGAVNWGWGPTGGRKLCPSRSPAESVRVLHGPRLF